MLTAHVRVRYNRLGQIASELPERADAIVAKAALDVEAGAKVRAPVDTGRLRSSIVARKVGEAHWIVTVGVEYGIYVEYGTRYMHAQPYLIPALEAVRGPFLEAMRRVAG